MVTDPLPIRYCIYARKSMEDEERQALSIDSQLKEMQIIAERDHLKIICIKTEAHSAKLSGSRPVFNEIIGDLKEDKYNAILTWAPDRLSRNAGDLGRLVDLMDQGHLVEILTFNQKFSDTPNEKFLLMILCSQAKFENDNKAVNVKRGLRTRVEMGLWPTGTPIGYRSLHRTDRPGELEVDEERAPIIKQSFEKVAYEGYTGHDILRWLASINFKSPLGNRLSLSSVQALLARHFYYGRFEYPVKSGNWYKGKHKTIITKKLFEDAQAAILRRKNVRKGDTGKTVVPFAFLHLMRCGSCGSGITAQEKYKQLKNGDLVSYRYYMCTHGRDRSCKERYINEEDLIMQIGAFFDTVDIDLIGMREDFEKEIHRLYRIEKYLTGEPFIERTHERRDTDLRAYAKETFLNGSTEERRKILYLLKSRIILKDKIVRLDPEAEHRVDLPPPQFQDFVLEIESSSRNPAFDLMGEHSLKPGMVRHIPGGAKLIFQGDHGDKKYPKRVTVSFIVSGLDDLACRMFISWLYEALARKKDSIRRISVNDHQMVFRKETLERAIARAATGLPQKRKKKIKTII